MLKRELEKLVKEEISSMLQSQSPDGEGSMARSQLARISQISDMLGDMIEEDTNLEEWVEAKITKAQDYLSAVLNYLQGESAKQVSEKLDPAKDDVGDYITDFRKSKAPQFKGKSDKKKRQMAVAAYLSAERDKK